MLFPAVSICNLNDMKLSKMEGTKLHKAIQERKSVLSLDGKEYTDTMRNANHRLEDMLDECTIQNKACTVQNFTQFSHNQGDRCFTFNSGHPGHPSIRVNNTGLKNSLEITVNIEHYDYYPDTRHSGLHLILHGQDETPVKMQGVMLSPGFVTYIKVKKRKVEIKMQYPSFYPASLCPIYFCPISFLFFLTLSSLIWSSFNLSHFTSSNEFQFVRYLFFRFHLASPCTQIPSS